MAAIGKIRQHSGLLIAVIGASIVGFLIMDATNSQFSILKGRNDTVGKVDGEKITINEFESRYEENIKNQEMQMRGQALTDDMRNYLRNQTWDQIVNQVIFDKVYDGLGLNVTPEEMNELATGENPHPYILQSFSNPQTGQFDPAQVRLFLQNLDKDDPGAEPGTRRRQWLMFEAEMKKSEFQMKYDNLISKGLYVPTWMAEENYDNQNRTADFNYASLPYAQVNDADVKVTDDELNSYIKNHAALFTKDEETRKINFVAFDIVASSSDSAQIEKDVAERREDLAKGKTVSEDSLYVKLYSEVPFDEAYLTKDQLAGSPVADSLFSLPVKSVIGPYLDGNSYRLAKISDRKLISDSVHLRQIIISFNGVQTQEEGTRKRALVDSIFKAIDSLHADFGAMAVRYSDDPLSKAKGGDAGWVKQGTKEKELNDLLFYRAQKGKTYLYGSGQDNAFYIFQVVEDRPTKLGVLATYVSKTLEPSPETERNIYGTASGFAADNQTADKFLAAGKKQNMKTVADLKADQFNVTGIGSARDLIKWAFKEKKGAVSSIFTMDKKYVVAELEDITPKGLAQLDEVRETVKSLVIRDKKFDLLAKKINDAKASNINDLAAKLGVVVQTADHATFTNPSLAGAYEPDVVATALVSKVGALSKPVKGNSGVYVVQTTAVQQPAKQSDYSIYAFQLKQKMVNKAGKAAEVQKKLADITDNRLEFF